MYVPKQPNHIAINGRARRSHCKAINSRRRRERDCSNVRGGVAWTCRNCQNHQRDYKIEMSKWWIFPPRIMRLIIRRIIKRRKSPNRRSSGIRFRIGVKVSRRALTALDKYWTLNICITNSAASKFCPMYHMDTFRLYSCQDIRLLYYHHFGFSYCPSRFL